MHTLFPESMKDELRQAPAVLLLLGVALWLFLAPAPVKTPVYGPDSLTWLGSPVDKVIFIGDASYDGRPCEVAVTSRGDASDAFICLSGEEPVRLTAGNVSALSFSDPGQAKVKAFPKERRQSAFIEKIIYLTKIIH